MAGNLDIATIIRLHKIFSNNDWMSKDGQEVVHGNLCKLLAVLNQQEKELILELCERYQWISFADYGKLVIKLFSNLAQREPQAPSVVYLAPVKKLSDESKTKSGDSLLYLLSGFMNFVPAPYNKVKYTWVKLIDIHSKKIALQENDKIFFVDDFLGSGNTFKEMLDDLSQNETLKTEKIEVLSLVAHQDGIDLLNKMGISSSVGIVHPRGISDHYEEPTKSEKISIMEGIERNITTNKKYKFGYNQSEGLVTLIKTPNNTFPFFWMTYKSQEALEPPFPRFQIEQQ